MDIKIKSEEGNFKYRVGGLLWKNDKLLLVQMHDNGFFAVPGGHVHLCESSSDAIVREIREEITKSVDIIQPLCIIENFFVGKFGQTHELSFYYTVKLQNENDLPLDNYIRYDDGDGKLDFRWFSIEELKDVDLRPAILKEKILSNNINFEVMTYNQIK